MNTTDPIADMLTRIRNANSAKFKTVDVPASKMKRAIAETLLEEGYIKAFEEIESDVQGIIRVTLKYDEKGNRVIDGLRRISKPGLRIYASKDELPRVLNGLGIALISTSKGIMTDKKARELGNKPITVPEGVDIKIDGQKVTVKGPKGTLEKEFHKNMKINLENNVLTIVRPDDQPVNRSLHGLTRTLLNNMIEGTTKGFERKLEVNGVGYRANKKGNDLLLNLGYSHPVEIEAPEGITFDVPNANEIIVKGMDKELVGQTAAVIRTKRPPEVYRGKGIKYTPIRDLERRKNDY